MRNNAKIIDFIRHLNTILNRFDLSRKRNVQGDKLLTVISNELSTSRCWLYQEY